MFRWPLWLSNNVVVPEINSDSTFLSTCEMSDDPSSVNDINHPHHPWPAGQGDAVAVTGDNIFMLQNRYEFSVV